MLKAPVSGNLIILAFVSTASISNALRLINPYGRSVAVCNSLLFKYFYLRWKTSLLTYTVTLLLAQCAPEDVVTMLIGNKCHKEDRRAVPTEIAAEVENSCIDFDLLLTLIFTDCPLNNIVYIIPQRAVALW